MKKLLNVREVEERCGLAKSTLDKMRLTGEGPPFVRLGRRRVAYALDDLETWIAQRTHRSTAEYQPRKSGQR